MIGLIVTMKVQAGKSAEFEKIFVDLSDQVRANEDGNILYQLTRSRVDPDTYKVLEFYRDEGSLKAHGATDHFRAASPQLGSCLAGKPEIEYLDAIA